MVNPVPGYVITTPYHKSGSMWSACSWHTGVDYAAPKGTPIVAAIAGTIRHRNYGSAFGPYQFAISPSEGQPFAADEVFYAHTLDRLPDGTEVQVGQQIAKVGDLGNVTGPHLHFEYHAGKNNWSCGVMRDPQPVIDHQSSGGGGGGGDGPFVTEHVYSNKVGMGEPSNGDAESDTVKELRLRLDNIPLVGGQTLGASPGVYDLDVDEEVRLWQEQVCGDTPDPAGQSYLGPNQFAKMFPSPPYTRHDVGLPAIASGGGSGGGDSSGGGSGGGDPPPAPPALMLPGAIWNPIPNFPGLRPFTGSAKKITLHTTETSVKPNWEQQQKGIPHLTLDLETGEAWQHLDFGIAAYTLNGGDHSPNSDSGQNVQIEIIGYSSEVRAWSDLKYAALHDVLQWLCTNLGIPYAFQVPFAAAGEAIRLGWDNEWEIVSGILGHEHAPYNDHTDPGALDTSRLYAPPNDGTDFITRREFEDFQESLAEAFRTIADMVDPDIA
jgi:hypothetical protein